MIIEIWEQGDRFVARTTFEEFLAANNAFEADEIAEMKAALDSNGEVTITGFVGCWWKLVRVPRRHDVVVKLGERIKMEP